MLSALEYIQIYFFLSPFRILTTTTQTTLSCFLANQTLLSKFWGRKKLDSSFLWKTHHFKLVMCHLFIFELLPHNHEWFCKLSVQSIMWFQMRCFCVFSWPASCVWTGWGSSTTETPWSSVTTTTLACVPRGASGCRFWTLRPVSLRATATFGWRSDTGAQVRGSHV